MIKSFRDRETEKVYTREGSGKLPGDIQQVALRKLRMIHNAKNLNDLRIPPANRPSNINEHGEWEGEAQQAFACGGGDASPFDRLEKLKGDRDGQFSVRINDQWRICFVWQDGDAGEVEITDYH